MKTCISKTTIEAGGQGEGRGWPYLHPRQGAHQHSGGGQGFLKICFS